MKTLSTYKIIIAYLVTLYVTSCTPPREFAKTTEAWWLDLSRHADAGFLITPHEYRGEYLGLAYIRVIAVPGGVEMGKREREAYIRRTGEEPVPVVPGYVVYLDEHDPNAIVDAFVEIAKSVGADGIMDFRAYYDRSLYYSPYESVNNRTTVVSGFAFRKK